MFRLTRLSFCLFAAFAMVPAFSGCGDSGPPTGDLKGSVSSSGKPVEDCRVVMYNPSTKRTVGAKTDDTGAFQIKDVPVGDYDIAVKQRVTNAIKEEPFDERIPEKYRDDKTSGFKISIVEGENSIDLKMEN